MTIANAAAHADEQIAHWHRTGVTADDAWRALGLQWAWAVEWREVRAMLIRWMLNPGADRRLMA